MKCFYHNADSDGKCSAAIIKLKFPNCELFGIDYKDTFPFDIIEKDEIIFMVDFSLPLNQMINLNNICDLQWYDHHSQIIKEAEKINFNPSGKRVIGHGVCRTIWYEFYSNYLLPDTIKYISNFDIYELNDINTIYFENGFNKIEYNLPDNIDLWYELLFDPDGSFINIILRNGKIITEYLESYHYKKIQENIFEQNIMVNNISYKGIFINHIDHKSIILKDYINLDNYDLQIFFHMIDKEKYKVSLFTTKEDIDCGKIASSFNGGGHQKAAGFFSNNNPLELFKAN